MAIPLHAVERVQPPCLTPLRKHVLPNTSSQTRAIEVPLFCVGKVLSTAVNGRALSLRPPEPTQSTAHDIFFILMCCVFKRSVRGRCCLEREDRLGGLRAVCGCGRRLGWRAARKRRMLGSEFVCGAFGGWVVRRGGARPEGAQRREEGRLLSAGRCSASAKGSRFGGASPPVSQTRFGAHVAACMRFRGLYTYEGSGKTLPSPAK